MNSFLDNVVDSLNAGAVVITYKSLNSGREVKGTYTLKGKHVGLNPNTDKLVAWDVENKKWEDIQIDTITMYVDLKVASIGDNSNVEALL